MTEEVTEEVAVEVAEIAAVLAMGILVAAAPAQIGDPMLDILNKQSVCTRLIKGSGMKTVVTMLATLMIALFACPSWAFTPPPSPAPQSWISDSSHVLSDAAHTRLDAKLKQINQSSANEIAALIVPTLDDAEIADMGDLTAKSWGVGKKDLDNGVLVVLAMKERKSRISTGKGVEGDLPDLKCNDILQQARPYLRKGDVEGALGFIFDSSAKAIANHKAEADTQANHTTATNTACAVSAVGAIGTDVGSVLFLIVLFALVTRAANRRRLRIEEEKGAYRSRLIMEQAQRLRQAREARATMPIPPPRPATPNMPKIDVLPPQPIKTYTPPETTIEKPAHHSREESSSSNSSWDSDSSGSGGFGGGDSGGGGSSSDW